eukprot:scpid22364/ scgid18779/ TNF receptor-associated factor 3; CD40 receptor-associated factor 1; TRAFAMN
MDSRPSQTRGEATCSSAPDLSKSQRHRKALKDGSLDEEGQHYTVDVKPPRYGDAGSVYSRHVRNSLTSARQHDSTASPIGQLRPGISASTPALSSTSASSSSERLLNERAINLVKEQEDAGIVSVVGATRASMPQLKGGYLHVFADDVRENLRCPVCLLVIRDAVQTPCGHLYCETCLRPILRGQRPRCPLDQIELVFSFADQHCRREVLQLRVLCDNQKEGCDWVGVLAELTSHLDICDYALVACSNIGCTEKMQRRLLSAHIRRDCPYRQDCCPHCKTSLRSALLIAHIQNDCPDVEVTCPVQGCTKKMARHLTTAHMDKECQERVTLCAFGCEEKVRRADLPMHLMDPVMNLLHAQHSMRLSGRLQASLQECQSQVHLLQQQLDDKERENQQLRDDVKKLKRDVHGKDSRALVKMEEKIETCQQLSQRNVCAVRDLSSSLQTVKEKSERRFTQEDRVAEQLDSLDLRMLELETTSYDGVLVWKILSFSHLLEEAKKPGGKTSHYSQPFYTGRHGYKACARLYPNGDGIGFGKALSLFFVVMAGEFDSIVPWPFHQRVTFTLFDQASTSQHHISETFLPDINSSSFKKPTSGMNVASGCPSFVTHTTLNASPHDYLKDDTLFLRIRIDKTNL